MSTSSSSGNTFASLFVTSAYISDGSSNFFPAPGLHTIALAILSAAGLKIVSQSSTDKHVIWTLQGEVSSALTLEKLKAQFATATDGKEKFDGLHATEERAGTITIRGIRGAPYFALSVTTLAL